MKEKLTIIVDEAIKNKDYDKLRYIGQSLDCMLFLKKYQEYWPLFKDIDLFLSNNNVDMLGELNITDYPDLNNIGLLECIAF